jgi:hypothetical protein
VFTEKGEGGGMLKAGKKRKEGSRKEGNKERHFEIL